VLVIFTFNPPAGAFAFNVTVPVVIWPEDALSGKKSNMSEETAGWFTVSVPIFWLPFRLAVIVTFVCTVTGLERMAKDALVVPAGTVTLGGTVTPGFELDSATAVPPAAAGPPRITVPVDAWPPVTVPGEMTRELTCKGCTIRLADTGLFRVPVIVTVICEVTVEVITVKLPVV